MVPPYDENDEFGEGGLNGNAPGEANAAGNK
jgi:hypothetical protein